MYSTPDITKAQVVGLVASATSAAVVLFKLDLTDAQQAALVTLAGVIFAAFHMVSDAIIRKGRAGIAAARETPAPTLPPITPADLGDGGAGGVVLSDGEDS